MVSVFWRDAGIGRAVVALRELCRVVPGGRVWVDALNCYSAPHLVQGAWRRLRGRPMHMRYDSPWELAALLRKRVLHGTGALVAIVAGGWQRLRVCLSHPVVEAAFNGLPPLAAAMSHAFVVRGYRPTA